MKMMMMKTRKISSECRLSDFPAAERLLPAPQALLVDIDAKPGTIGHDDMAALDVQGRDRDILGEPVARQGQPPSQAWNAGGNVQRGR